MSATLAGYWLVYWYYIVYWLTIGSFNGTSTLTDHRLVSCLSPDRSCPMRSAWLEGCWVQITLLLSLTLRIPPTHNSTRYNLLVYLLYHPLQPIWFAGSSFRKYNTLFLFFYFKDPYFCHATVCLWCSINTDHKFLRLGDIVLVTMWGLDGMFPVPCVTSPLSL